MGQIEKLDRLCDLIYETAKISKSNFRSLEKKDISRKVGFDLVTKVDKESEGFLKKGLKDIDPKASFLGEETGYDDSGDESNRERSWIVDPLDGTRNFVQGLPFFSISVAFSKSFLNEIEIGVIYDVIHDEMFIASKGNGSWLKAKDGKFRINVSDTKGLEGSMIATGFPHKEKHRIKEFSRQFESLFSKCGGIRRMGSAALDLAYTACGRFDCFWEAGLSVWDIAAGVLIVQEAGGIVSDFSGGDSYLKSGDIVASNNHFHTDLLNQIKIV